jgi:hypothetical protein
MSFAKRSVYIFSDASDSGIFHIPEDRLILLEATHELWIKTDNDGLTVDSTLQDAINNFKLHGKNLTPPPNVWHPWNDGVGSNLDAALWGGHRLIAVSTSEPTPTQGVDGDIWFQRDA